MKNSKQIADYVFSVRDEHDKRQKIKAARLRKTGFVCSLACMMCLVAVGINQLYPVFNELPEVSSIETTHVVQLPGDEDITEPSENNSDVTQDLQEPTENNAESENAVTTAVNESESVVTITTPVNINNSEASVTTFTWPHWFELWATHTDIHPMQGQLTTTTIPTITTKPIIPGLPTVTTTPPMNNGDESGTLENIVTDNFLHETNPIVSNVPVTTTTAPIQTTTTHRITMEYASIVTSIGVVTIKPTTQTSCFTSVTAVTTTEYDWVAPPETDSESNEPTMPPADDLPPSGTVPIAEIFRDISFDGTDYVYNWDYYTDTNYVDVQLGTATAWGMAEDASSSMTVQIYSVKNFGAEYIAVKFPDDDRYYIYKST